MIFTEQDLRKAYNLYNGGFSYEEVLNFFKNKQRPLYNKEKIDLLVEVVCYHFNISEESLKSDARDRSLVDARAMYYMLSRKHTSYSLETIGNIVNRTHTTVLNGFNQIKDLLDAGDKKITEDYHCLEEFYKGAMEIKEAKKKKEEECILKKNC